jgi:hypothetical protein
LIERAPRPSAEASLAEVADTILKLINLVDQLNLMSGKESVRRGLENMPLGKTEVKNRFYPFEIYFYPIAPPLGPDFDFRFSWQGDNERDVTFVVQGRERYSCFMLVGQLTKPNSVGVAKQLPLPKLTVKTFSSITVPTTRHAKRLRNLFVQKYQALDATRVFG